jgi:hypothetical protein
LIAGFRHMSARRKALLATFSAVLLAMGLLSWLGVAGFRGTQPREMDWNGDGTVTRSEILQGYTLVAVTESTEGRRTCRSYAWLGRRADPVRVDCRVEVASGNAE